MMKNKEWVRTFEVQIVEESVEPKEIYQVISFLFPASSPEASTKLVTRKSFADFKNLYQALNRIHHGLNLPGSLPVVHSRGSFLKKIGVEERRKQCVNLLYSAAKFVELYNSQG